MKQFFVFYVSVHDAAERKILTFTWDNKQLHLLIDYTYIYVFNVFVASKKKTFLGMKFCTYEVCFHSYKLMWERVYVFASVNRGLRSTIISNIINVC